MATDKDRFELLYTNLKGYHDGLWDSAFKVTGSWLIVIGWLVSSKDAQGFLHDRSQLAVLGAIVLLFSAVMYAFFTAGLYKMSRKVFAELGALNYLPVEDFSERQISLTTSIILVAFNFALTVLACIVMWSILYPAKV